MSYTNADGLFILTHEDQGNINKGGTTAVANRQVVTWDLDLTALKTTFGAVDIQANDAYIPAGSVIVGATLVVIDAATSGGSATLTIGTYNAAGTAIDADGIDAAVALTVIDAAGDVVRCDGAQVTGVLGYVSANAYIGALYATAAYTAGRVKLIVEYVKL
jgi:hypothetical protein